MKPKQVEYWCLQYGSDIDMWRIPEQKIELCVGDGDGSPSECVWIIPYENPWLMDWD